MEKRQSKTIGRQSRAVTFLRYLLGTEMLVTKLANDRSGGDTRVRVARLTRDVRRVLRTGRRVA